MAALEDLKEFDVDNASLSLWVFKKSNRTGQPPVFTGRWVDTAEDLDGALKQAVTNERDRIQEVHDYTLLAQTNEASALTLDAVETHSGLLLDEVAGEVANKKVNNLKKVQNAHFYVVKLVADDDTIVYAVTKTDASWRTKKSLSTITAYFEDDQMGLDDRPRFNISRHVDFFIVGDSILVSNKRNFEGILNYKVHHQQDFTELQAEQQFIAVFSDVAPIVAHVGDNKINLRRIAAIKQKGHYKDAGFMTNLRAHHAAYGLTLVFDANGRIVPTPETCRDIFAALLDHRLKSGFSSNVYDVPDATQVAVQ